MKSGYYEIIHWGKYQHYKKRRPPWFKLYQDLFSSSAWVDGDDASRALMIASMMLASRTQNKIPARPGYIRKVACLNSDPDFTHLLDTEFVRFVEDASNMPASCGQNAIPETEKETEKEEERNGQAGKIPSPSPQKSETENDGPSANPDPLPLARPDAPETRDPLPMGPGRGEGNSLEAVHTRQQEARAVGSVKPGQPPPSAPPSGVESDCGLSDSSRGRSGKQIHVDDKTLEAGSQLGTREGAPEPCKAAARVPLQSGPASNSSTPNTPGGRDTTPPPAQVRAEPSHGPRGASPSRLGDVIESQLGKAHIPTKADNWELVVVTELQQVFADLWHQDISPILPTGDNLLRVLEALRHPTIGIDGCKAAIRGHYMIASKDNSPHGRTFRLVFPPMSRGGSRRTERLDVDRVLEYAQTGKPPRRRQEVKPKPPPCTREESERAAKKWIGVAKQNIAGAQAQEES